MRVIITRPEQDAVLLAHKLLSLGHVPLMLPLINIVTRQNIQIPTKPYQAICLTSANGVRSLKDVSKISNLPFVAVGAQTLDAATKSGLTNGVAEGGDVDGLVAYIAKTFTARAGPLLYVSGSETSGDLQGKLQMLGFEVDRLITYDALPVEFTGFKKQILDANSVVLYSPRTAKIWRHGIETLGVNISRIKHFCLSPNVAAGLPQNWTKFIATWPTEDHLVAMLDSVAKAE